MAVEYDYEIYDNLTYVIPVHAECNDIHYVNSSDFCAFAMTVEDCVEMIEYIDYNHFIFCRFGYQKLLPAVLICIMWLLLLFIALGVTSNCFLCPDLFAISKHLRLSQNVAGVTLLAFGNGAPDIFSSAAGLQKASAELAIASLVGAGTFVTTVVAGSVFLTQNFSLTTRPFLRDISFYVIAVSWAFSLFHFGRYYVFHGIGFVAVYVLYIIVVLGSRFIYVSRAKKEHKNQNTNGQNKLNSKSQNYEFPGYQEARSVALKAYYFAGLDYFEDDSSSESHGCHLQGVENNGFSYSASNLKTVCSEKIPGQQYAEVLDQSSKKKTKAEDEFWEFLKALCPINLEKWSDYDWWGKTSSIIKSPAVLVLRLTVPVLDTTADDGRWCRYLSCIHCMTGPLFITVISNYAFVMIGGVIPVALLVGCVGFAAAVTVLLNTDGNHPPTYHWVFAYLGFIVAVTWIYCLANEIVALLQVFGVVFNLSDAILGLTVLAWGNSLSDFLSNIAVARKKFPRMGIAACFGGPLLALLLGLGIPLIVEVMKGRAPAPEPLLFSGQFVVLFLTLGVSLVMTTVTSAIWRFQTKRCYGVLLIALYFIFVTLSVLVEFKILKI